MELRRCPVKGCERTLEGQQIVCPRCWRRTPGAFRGAYFLAYRRGRPAAQAERVAEIVEWLDQHPEPCDAAGARG